MSALYSAIADQSFPPTLDRPRLRPAPVEHSGLSPSQPSVSSTPSTADYSLFRPPPASLFTIAICKPVSLSFSPYFSSPTTFSLSPLYIRSLSSPTSMDRSQICSTSQPPHQHRLLPTTTTATAAGATKHLISVASPRRSLAHLLPSLSLVSRPFFLGRFAAVSLSPAVPPWSPSRLSFRFSSRSCQIAFSDGRNNVNARSSGNILITVSPNSPIFACLERLVVGDSVLGEELVDWGMFLS